MVVDIKCMACGLISKGDSPPDKCKCGNTNPYLFTRYVPYSGVLRPEDKEWMEQKKADDKRFEDEMVSLLKQHIRLVDDSLYRLTAIWVIRHIKRRAASLSMFTYEKPSSTSKHA